MKKTTLMRAAFWLLLGAACFLISQPLLRLPLLNLIQSTTDYNLFAMLHPFITILCIGFSAGVFEEGLRFAFKLFLMKPAQCRMIQPILFGLGHGITEACIILIPLFLTGYTIDMLGLAITERALTIVLHVGLTVLVWNGFQTRQKVRYLIAAITVHGLVDTVFPILQRAGLSAIYIELIYGIFVLLMVAYIVFSKKFYFTGGSSDEKPVQIIS